MSGISPDEAIVPAESLSNAPTGSAAGTDDDKPRRRRIYPTILRALTFTQNTSAAVFAGFLTLHLVSPLAAAVGGSSLADKTMMISRDVYLPLEIPLIYLPLTLHLSSSLLKRLLITYRTRRPPALLSNTHLLTGYLFIALLIPHTALHRLIPSSPSAPVSALSPAELDFSFVGWSIQRYPVWSTLGYLALVTVGSLHAGIGAMKIVSYFRPKRRDMGLGVKQPDTEGQEPRRVVPKRRKLGLRGILVALVGIVAVGLVRIRSDTGLVGRVMEKRYEAVYARLLGGAIMP
ncbi:hypothetical protein BCR39DRAFT_481417 [Naematelia encephala]|uniref:Mitochondrial adapter protein MCP1 transmembrane domain-containing protein n=1 Tax=Naematelia encephala TaxID=71784 RepID=A0A1Y2B5J7_9TREE|nr:hypothetical protein BCR39DRAFT_481417 [Naematelia encephala]